MSNELHPTCKCCGRRPEEITEYKEGAADMGMTPSVYVILEEGTYNKVTRKFYCTSCYIKAGMPMGKA